MVQQKQRKQFILTDNRNISTCRFQSIQHLQPHFTTDGIRNFMYTKHNEDNVYTPILWITEQEFSNIPNN